MAGYSGTPLAKKLGIKERFRVGLVHSLEGFEKELGVLPPEAEIVRRLKKPLDLILLFAKSGAVLKNDFEKLTEMLAPDGMIWVAWPKKSSGVATDLSFDIVQKVGLNAGLVDVKICAVNDIWSGLRFVYRLKDRPHMAR